MTRIDTPRGPIKAYTEDGLLIARSIPYATAERWKHPIPARWQEEKDCTKVGPWCPQHQFRFEFVIGELPLDRPMTEDCLRLSVIAPENAKNLPVMIWIHGGANISGGADVKVMDTSALARLGVVTVCIQYRLGLYGCVEIPELAPANLHIYDQMEALKWVKECCSSFGGDPEQITLMGQSAGGWGVYNMLLAPTDGLFKRAVIISSPIDMQPKGGLGDLVKKRLPGDLLDIQEEMVKLKDGSVDDFTADRRKAPFPKDLEARIAERKDIDILVGWAADDCLPFIRLIPAGRMLMSVPYAGPYMEYWVGAIATTMLFKRPSQQLVQKWLTNGGNATSFEFKWYPKGSPFRACHCIEMPFMFGGWATWAAAPLLVGEESEEVVARISPLFKDMLVTFIKTGLKKGKHIEIKSDFSEKAYL